MSDGDLTHVLGLLALMLACAKLLGSACASIGPAVLAGRDACRGDPGQVAFRSDRPGNCRAARDCSVRAGHLSLSGGARSGRPEIPRSHRARHRSGPRGSVPAIPPRLGGVRGGRLPSHVAIGAGTRRHGHEPGRHGALAVRPEPPEGAGKPDHHRGRPPGQHSLA